MISYYLTYGLVALGVYILARNFATFHNGMAILNEDGVDAYTKLPTYNAMMLSPKYVLLWTPTHWRAWIRRQAK